MLWLRRHNSTSQCLDGERHGPLWSWIRCLLKSFLDIDDEERGQDIESDGEDRGDGCGWRRGCGKESAPVDPATGPFPPSQVTLSVIVIESDCLAKPSEPNK